MSMSQNDIINKLMKQWQRDVDKYRNELIKYKTELDELRKEMVSLKANHGVKVNPVQEPPLKVNPVKVNTMQESMMKENLMKGNLVQEKVQPVPQPPTAPTASTVSTTANTTVNPAANTSTNTSTNTTANTATNPAANMSAAVSTPPTPTYIMEQRADVFFDYTVMFSENDEEIIVYANLHMKNTGNVHLENPLICIRVEPPGLAKISGKILPPNAVEAMGVYTLDGAMEGWVFTKKGEEWEKDVKKGEYWIQSLQPIVIPPGQSEALKGFQFILPRDKSQKRFVVNGIAFLNSTQYVSNNKISLQLI